VFLYFHADFSAEKHVPATGSQILSSTARAQPYPYIFSSRLLWPAQDLGRIAAADGRFQHPPRSFRERGAGTPSVNPLEVKT